MTPPHATYDELPIFRPRFGKGRVSPDDRGLSAGVLARLPAATARVRRALGRRARIATRPPGPESRRVVVKARYVKLAARGATAATLHLKYIQRDGVERDGSPGVLYGPEGPIPAETFEAPRLREEHQFRFIVSPEDAAELDLAAYVRSLMARVERDVGRPLEWAAVNHYNTEHPHAHIVVRGVDRHGRPLRFDREYISRGMRERAQELATQELGPRREDEVQRARQREVTQERFTSLDRELERRVADGQVRRADLEPRTRSSPKGDFLVGRLAVLEGMRLAERVEPGVWKLDPNWKRQLRDLGERGDIVRQMHAAVRGDPARYRDLRPGDALPGSTEAGPPPPVRGKVRAKALADEMRGTVCAIVETPEGAAYRVPLDARSAGECRVGDFVELRTLPKARHRPEDLAIEAMARAAGGRCAPETAADPQATPLRRRLQQLQALGIARPDGPGIWRVPVPLVEALERLDRERPDHRLVVRTDRRSVEHQVRVRGPVWLDGLEPQDLAPHGLGAELRDALEQRARALRSFGIEPSDPRKLSQLRELERSELGERAASATGLAFVLHPPDGFRGRVGEAPAAAGYAVITDGARMTVLPMTRELHDLLGRTVTLGRDASGRVRPTVVPDLDRGG